MMKIYSALSQDDKLDKKNPKHNIYFTQEKVEKLIFLGGGRGLRFCFSKEGDFVCLYLYFKQLKRKKNE